jgi:hypothetical protein
VSIVRCENCDEPRKGEPTESVEIGPIVRLGWKCEICRWWNWLIPDDD